MNSDETKLTIRERGQAVLCLCLLCLVASYSSAAEGVPLQVVVIPTLLMMTGPIVGMVEVFTFKEGSIAAAIPLLLTSLVVSMFPLIASMKSTKYARLLFYFGIIGWFVSGFLFTLGVRV